MVGFALELSSHTPFPGQDLMWLSCSLSSGKESLIFCGKPSSLHSQWPHSDCEDGFVMVISSITIPGLSDRFRPGHVTLSGPLRNTRTPWVRGLSPTPCWIRQDVACWRKGHTGGMESEWWAEAPPKLLGPTLPSDFPSCFWFSVFIEMSWEHPYLWHWDTERSGSYSDGRDGAPKKLETQSSIRLGYKDCQSE